MTQATADGDAAAIPADHDAGHQHHPLKVYFVVWGWLFVLSAASYMVDIAGFEGLLRWTLILIFMMLKAGLIVAVFMHFQWERLSLVYAILLPTLAILVFVAIMVFESDYTLFGRETYFVEEDFTPAPYVHEQATH